ncbi:MAG: hypothetical protein JWO11_2166 [Nocardioides sp.]|nr:hypothetical protein [Nocardioides sp.]
MPTELSTAQHLEGLRAAMAAFVRYADRAGLTAAVPTCPDWNVRDLVAHQSMAHRWAAALLRDDTPGAVDPDAFEAAGREANDPLEWLREGAAELAQTIEAAPLDAHAIVFLNDAPAPRAFWARRQCHETTMHAVDALAAALGREPDAGETWIDPVLAVDGIDELLGGFLTKPRSRLRSEEELSLVVVPDDADDWWAVSVGPGPAVTTRRTGPVAEGDVELTGPAVELYLRLWNRTAAEPPAAGALARGGERRRLTAISWT